MRNKRMIIDIIMTVLLYVLMAYHYTSQLWHEITGAAMFVLFILHHIINRGWYKSLFSGKYNVLRILVTIIDVTLLIDIIILMISGIAMSHYVFRYIPMPLGMTLARELHLIGAYLGFLLMSFHIGLHINVMLNMLRHKNTGFMKIIILLISCYGVYALTKRNFPGYILGNVKFAYFDYSEIPIFFFLDYIAIMILMITAAYLIRRMVITGICGLFHNIENNIKKHRIRYIVLAIILVILIIMFFVFGGVTYMRRHYQTVSVDRNAATHTGQIDMGDKKGVIIYFTRVGNTAFDEDVDAVSSASLMEENGKLIGNSELLSDMLANATGYPVYPIHTVKLYSSSYGDTVNEAKEEMDRGTPSELKEDIPELSEYDTVILVYPLWWWTLPMPVQTFLTETDLEGKTIYSLVTHGGSGYGTAIEDTRKYTKAAVSDNNLEVYDDDVTESLVRVKEWVSQIAAE